MRAVRGHDGQPLLVEVDEPPGQGELLSMRAVGICASDLGYLSYGTNVILGHELVGIRSDGTPVAVEGLYGCGDCGRCRVGQYNLCGQAAVQALGMFHDGGMVEQFRAPSERLVELPAGLDVASGSVVEPAAVSWHGVRVGGTDGGKRVAVVGAGSVGMLAVAAAQAQRAAEVSLESRYDQPLRSPRRRGRKALSLRVAPRAPVGSGSASALQRCVELLAPGGTIAVLGVHYGGLDVPYLLMLTKEAKLVASMPTAATRVDATCSRPRRCWPPALRSPMPSSPTGSRWEDAAEAFRVAADRKSGAIKVVVEVG